MIRKFINGLIIDMKSRINIDNNEVSLQNQEDY